MLRRMVIVIIAIITFLAVAFAALLWVTRIALAFRRQNYPFDSRTGTRPKSTYARRRQPRRCVREAFWDVLRGCCRHAAQTLMWCATCLKD